MTAKEANFTIKFNGDTGALVQDLQKLKGVVEKLDLSSTMKANFTKVFSDLEKSLGKIGDGFANGLKDNRSIAVFEQNLEQSGRLLDKLKQSLLSIPEDVIKKAFTADPQELDNIKYQIDALNKKINDEALVAFGNLEKKLEALGDKTNAQALKDFIKNLKSGDVEQAAKDFKKLQNYFARVTEGSEKWKIWYEAIDAIDKEFKKLLPSVTETRTEIGKLEAQQAELNETAGAKGAQSINNIALGLDDVKNSSQQAGQSFIETSKDANSLQKELDGFKNKAAYFFGLNNAVRLFQRALRSAFETVKDLDKVMTETAVVTEFSVGDMWTQLPEYTQRANELGVSIHDVYEASTLYYQQGLKTNEVMAVTNATLKMARIAGLEASEATDRMTNALRGFNMEITEANANNIADVYSKLAAITASNVDEISTAMTKTASLAASANMSFENTAAFLAQIIETTRESAETAGTALKTVIARFSEVKKLYSEGELLGTDAEGEAIDINKVSTALRTAGIDMNEFLTGAKGLDEVFIELASKWNSLTLVQQRYIATMAAGSRQQSRFIALMSDYQRTMQLTGAANNAAGASTKQYEKTLESFQTKVERLKNAYNEFVLGIANSSVIKAGIDLLTGILTKLNELTKSANKTGTSFKKLMLSIGLFSGAKAVLKGFEKNILGSIAKAFGKEGQDSGKSFIDGLKDSLGKAKSVFTKDFWVGTTDFNASLQLLEQAAKGTEGSLQKLGITTQAFNALQQSSLSISEQAILVNNKNAVAILNNAVAYDAETGALKEEYLEKLKKITTDELENKTTKMGILGILGERAARLMNAVGIKVENSAIYKHIIAKQAENGVLKENIALQMASCWYLAIIIAAVAALTILIIALAKAVKESSTAFKLEEVKEQLDSINDLLDESKTKLDNLLDSTDKLSELDKGFEGLEKGTEEWTAQLAKANQAVIDLISENPELGEFVSIGEHGQLTITGEGLALVIQQQTDKIIDLQRQSLGLETQYSKLQGRQNSYEILQKDTLVAALSETGIADICLKILQAMALITNPLNALLQAVVIDFGARGLLKAFGLNADPSVQNASERANYGGLMYDEFYKVAAKMLEQGINSQNARERKSDIEAIFNDYGVTASIDHFINKVENLGTTFDELAIEANKVRQTELANIIERAAAGGEYSAGQLELINLYKEKIAEDTAEGKINLFKTSAEDLATAGMKQVLPGVFKYTDNAGKGHIVGPNFWNTDAGKEFLNRYKNDVVEQQQFDAYAEAYNRLGTITQNVLKGDLSVTKGQLKGANIDLLALADLGINPKLMQDELNAQKNKISAVFSNISSWLPDNVVDKLTYGTAQTIAEGLNPVPVAFKQRYTNKITSFLDSIDLNDEQYNVAMQHLMLGNFDAFKEYLVEIGKDIPSSKLNEFQGALGAFNESFKLTNLNELTKNLKELDNVMGKVAEGTKEYSTEEMSQMIESGGANEEDFIKIGDDVYYFRGNLDEVGETMAQKSLEELIAYRAGMETPGVYYDAQAAAIGERTVGYSPEEKRQIDKQILGGYSSAGARGFRRFGSEEEMAAWDEGLKVRIEKDYPQLIGLVDELTKAQEREAKESVRAAASLAIANEKARASFKNLTSAVQDNLEVLKKEYRGTDEYAEALENITQYAKEAFSQDITSDFIDQNLDLFIDFANGVEGSTRKIQDALLDTVTDTGLNVNVIRTAIESLDQAEFDIYGQADFGPIYDALDKVATDSTELAAYLTALEGLGFKIEYTYDKDGNINGGKIVNIGEQQRQRNFRSYGGGGSKSSGGSAAKLWENPYDELYNLTQKINTQLREREKLEKDYDRLLQRRSESVEEIKQKSLDILAALYRERDLNQQLLEGRRQQAAKILNQAYLDDDGTFKTFGQMGMAKYGSIDVNTGEVQINWDLIDSVTDAIEGARISAYISALEEAGKNIQDTTDEIEEIDDKIYEEQQRGKQDYLELEERVYQALVNQQQKIIDGYKTLSDAITDANQQIISSLRESIEMERQIRDNTKKEEDIADKEARLAYLRRDTSGANDTEIMKLEKELGEAREQYADSLVDQAIADLEDQNEKASEQRQKQIDLMQSQLDYWTTNGHYWEDVHELIKTGMVNGKFDPNSSLVKLLKEDDNFSGLSTFGQDNWMEQMAEAYASAMTGEMYWEGVDLKESGRAGEQLKQIAEASRRIGTSTSSPGDNDPVTPPPPPPRTWGSLSADEKYAAILHMTSAEEKAIAKLLGIDLDEFDLTDANIYSKVLALLNLGRYKLSKFASGGLVTSTGPAWLDGSLSSPEMVLNAKDTANLIQLKSILAQILSGGTIPGGGGDNYYNIDINVDELGSDYDVDKIAARIKQKIYDDSIYRNVNAINYIR